METSAPSFPLGLLLVSLEDFFCMVLLVPGKHSQCNVPGTNVNLLLSSWFNAEEVKLCAETEGVVRVSVTQVCFRERQGSQEEIESWWKGVLTALCLCTSPFFFFPL